MCMEMYHGDEDYIEYEEKETERLKEEYAAELYIENYFLNKIDNDPAWVA